MESISILGCGWLGLPLGGYLVKKGYRVKGSTTEEDKLSKIEEMKIEPCLLILKPEMQGGRIKGFFDSDVLIVNFPPERRDDIVRYHQKQIECLISAVEESMVKNVIFVSSTSVYPDVNRGVFEHEELKPTKSSGKALAQVEELLRNCDKFNTTVIRLGGLIGYDRMPGRFLSGKKDLADGDAPVNLIHRDDCIEIIYRIIRNNIWGETFNACADLHPTRKEFYTEQTRIIGLTPPSFNESIKSSFKIVNNEKLKRVLNYKFKYPDPSKIIET